MCIFIAACLPKSADHVALDGLARAYQRRFRPQDNESIEKQLGPVFSWFLTTHGHCDCGTSLGGARDREARAKDWVAVEQKLVKRGWSRAKVERTLAQMHEQEERPAPSSTATGNPDLERWREFIEAVLESGLTHEIGLLIRMYSGSQAAAFDIRERRAVKFAEIATTLPLMEEDVLYVFKAR